MNYLTNIYGGTGAGLKWRLRRQPNTPAPGGSGSETLAVIRKNKDRVKKREQIGKSNFFCYHFQMEQKQVIFGRIRKKITKDSLYRTVPFSECNVGAQVNGPTLSETFFGEFFGASGSDAHKLSPGGDAYSCQVHEYCTVELIWVAYF